MGRDVRGGVRHGNSIYLGRRDRSIRSGTRNRAREAEESGPHGMNFFAQLVLIAWIPLLMLLFGIVPPRRAVIVASVVAWLFLPVAEFKLPGLSDYSKTTATTV